MSELLKRLKANSTIKETSVLKESKYFTSNDMISTEVYAYNVALGGSLSGGFTPGLTVLAGPSKNFKTGFLLLMIKTYLDKYPDSICLFYDSEFGAPQSYFESMGIDTNRVLHTPIMDIEEMRHDLAKQLQDIKRGDKIFIAVDSVGNLASRKESQDAVDGSDKADMTRAKILKSTFRIVTPYLTKLDLPMVVINHTYKTMEMFSKDVVSGGTGIYYSAQNIFIMGRQQDKDSSKELVGHNFVINIEKSRFVKEKSKILINVNFETGINKYSGLLDMALESGHVCKPKVGWYAKVDMSTGEVTPKNYREKDISNKDFWESILADETFHKWVEKKYKLSHNEMIQDDTLDEEVNELMETEA